MRRPRIIWACQRSERSKANCQAVRRQFFQKNKWTNFFLFDYSSVQNVKKNILCFGRIGGLAICFQKLLIFSNVKLKAEDEPNFLAFSEYLNFTYSYVLFLVELNPWTAMAFESKFFIRSTDLDKIFYWSQKIALTFFFGDFQSR